MSFSVPGPGMRQMKDFPRYFSVSELSRTEKSQDLFVIPAFRQRISTISDSGTPRTSAVIRIAREPEL